MPDAKALVARTVEAAQALFDAEEPSLPDVQVRTNVGMCSLVLAAYRSLAALGVERADAIEITRRTFFRTFRASTTASRT